jgi:hypothetical protein
MKKFVLNLSGYESQAMALRGIRKLYHEGSISRHTPCRARGAEGWSTVDDMFPMLKYEPRSKLCIAGWTGPMRRAATKLLVMPANGERARLVSAASLF